MIQSAKHTHTPVHIHFTSELNLKLQSEKAHRDPALSSNGDPILITLFKWNIHFVVKSVVPTAVQKKGHDVTLDVSAV